MRTRPHPSGLVSRSRELLAYASSPFWTGFAFARASCVHVFTLLDWFRVRVFNLLDWFRVRESFLRTRLQPFGLVSRSRELLAYTSSPFWTGFAFARVSCVRVLTPFRQFRARVDPLAPYFLIPTNNKSVCNSIYSSSVYSL
ncbi:hypothetical protein NEOCIP111885_00393 [Pseudoneobacillus rhizosphaerae]|uniref:Uncharacterized protein n=1 Tax=Pseudoneobacillus rhizosphaerae TaxID=2880968 RepID=A0A9C7L9T7_9BACI|nr:hypothetical protein NEOCIP111885_00393 [Pseudoneobacillus rhizosphaerae]